MASSGNVENPPLPAGTHEQAVTKLNIVVVGDSKIGKTAMCQQYANMADNAVEKNDLVMYDQFPCCVTSCGGAYKVLKKYKLFVNDLTGLEGSDDLRHECYADVSMSRHESVVFICFATGCRASLGHAKKKWLAEIRGSIEKKLPVILVGIAANNRIRIVKSEEARYMQKMMGAEAYMEVCPPGVVGIKALFDHAIYVGLLKNEKQVERPRPRFWFSRSFPFIHFRFGGD